MIRHGRPTITEAEIAHRVGTPIATWRRRDAPAFRAAVPNLLAGRFFRYDEAQADAYLAGQPIPALPDDPQPDDLLTDVEVGEILGIPNSSVRSLAGRGYLAKGERLDGARVWPRHQVEDRQAHAPGQGAGGGRPADQPRPTKPHPYAGDPRLQTAAAALAATEHRGEATPASERSIAAELAGRHGGSTRTWERIIAAIRRPDATP